MTKTLTPGQHLVLQWVRDFIRANGWSPSIREACAGLGWSSPSTVHRHLTNLERGGYVERGAGIRQVRLTDKGKEVTL